jgi:phage FluMu protein Com
METVQLQCGSCNKLMAISTQHLGVQVRCPHCKAVVQAPPRPPAPSAESPPPEIAAPPPVEPRDVESIFTPAEPSDDLFDAGPQRPLVEMPVVELQPIAPPPAPSLVPPPPGDGITADTPPPILQDNVEPPPLFSEGPPAETHTEAHADLAALQPRPRAIVDRGYLSLMALIFLVPYSVLMTLFVIYLWYQLATQEHGLRILPDPVPNPKKDGAQQVREKHDQPLSADLKVALGNTIRIGELQVTPKKVVHDALGDLELTLHVKNVSANQVFSPVHPDFLKVSLGGKTMPYTFLESRNFKSLYGGHLAFQRGEGGDKTIDGALKPGQEEDVLVTTRGDNSKEIVQRIVQSKNENLLWRIQVRRGLVPSDGQPVSATAVIGVQFSARDIGKGI